MRHDEVRQQLVDRRVALDRQAFVLGGALLAEVLLDLLAVFDLGQVDGGGLLQLSHFIVLACFLHVGKCRSCNDKIVFCTAREASITLSPGHSTVRLF